MFAAPDVYVEVTKKETSNETINHFSDAPVMIVYTGPISLIQHTEIQVEGVGRLAISLYVKYNRGYNLSQAYILEKGTVLVMY